MKTKHHIRILISATIVWFIFFILGLPDYYLQYSTTTMIWFAILVLFSISFIIWFVLKKIKRSRRMNIALWYSFYFTIPLAIYDYLYCGIYLKYGIKFIFVFWILSVYYLILWILFPLIAFILNSRKATKFLKE